MAKIILPPVPRSLEKLRAFLEPSLGRVASSDRQQIVLAVQEAATNYIKHAEKAADGCPLVVQIEITEHELIVRIPLFCRKGVERSIHPRPLEQVRPGGLGTHFIREIMDRVDYVPGPEGFMTLELARTLKRDSRPAARPGQDATSQDATAEGRKD